MLTCEKFHYTFLSEKNITQRVYMYVWCVRVRVHKTNQEGVCEE